MMRIIPEIKTTRLSLHPLTQHDQAAIADIKAISHIKAQDWINLRLAESGFSSYVWMVEYKDLLIGTVCFWNIENHQAEIGYEILPAYRKQGFAIEACVALLDIAPVLGLKKIEAFCDKTNVASIQTALKAGFDYDRSWEDFDVYTKLI